MPVKARDPASEHRNPLLSFLRLCGPGLISGAADDDPTGIGTYAQAGAVSGYGLLWTTLLTLPMMATVQYIAAKVGIVHRRGLTGVLERHFPRPIVAAAVIALIAANIINAGVDIGAIAAAANLVVPIPVTILVLPVAILLLVFLIFGSYRLIENTFKWLTLALLAYIVSSFLSHPNVPAMLHGTFIPTISFQASFLSLFVATLGGNVSPYLMFWQADMEVEEGETAPDQKKPSRVRTRTTLKRTAWDTIIGMVFSNVIIFFIEVSSAATLFAHGKHNVTSAVQAAQALKPLLGSGATILWAVGMIGSGLLAVPALTGSIADAVSTLLGWRHGLNARPSKAWHFYLLLTIAMVAAAFINFLHVNPIQALVLAATLNGLMTPPLLVLLMLVSGRKEVMGENVNGLGLNLLGWGTTTIMFVAALGLIVTLL